MIPVITLDGPSGSGKGTISSLLAQKLLGTHTIGTIMPPGGKLPDDVNHIILRWIDAGAPDN